MRRPGFWGLVLIFAWTVLALLLFIPVGNVLVASLYDRAGEFTFGNYAAFIEQPRFRRAFVNTLVVGFSGLAGALILGTIMAYCLSRFVIAGSRFVSMLAILALVS
ncbi:MAG: iron ABC transporter permease, partial [Alphaproteobacteria bacterium]|nr:iron ABC transporter permease [Alphaproteobacteria bacterium]